jgi:hypothetical protein
MQIRLSPEAKRALADLALRERRDTRSQAEHIVVASLRRRGLIRPADETGARPTETRTRVSGSEPIKPVDKPTSRRTTWN